MGLGEWLASKLAPPKVAENVPSIGGDDYMAVAGESHHRQQLAKATGSGLGEYQRTALLCREPANSHDAKAVAVTIQGGTVGYLKADVAAEFAARIDGLGGHVTCPALVRRDSPSHDWNVILRVDYDLLRSR